MPNYTLCPQILSHCCKETDRYYFYNILSILAIDGPIKITIDSQKKALKIYSEYAKSHYNVFDWLKTLDKAKRNPFSEVIIPNRKYSETNLFVEICAHTVGDKILFTSDKQTYKNTKWKEYEIELLDKDEAVEKLKDRKEIIMTQIKDSQISNIKAGRDVKDINLNQNKTISKGTIDLTKLADELSKIRAELKKEQSQNDDVELDEAVGSIASAEKAAKAGDEKSALQHLKSAGKWGVDIATKIGTTLAASLIKDSIS